MSDDAVAQFMAITSSEAETAQQYLGASDYNLEQAIELFFASGGVSTDSQTNATAIGGNSDNVRERIEGFDDQLVDEEAQFYNEVMRNSQRAEARAHQPRGIFNQDRDADISEVGMSKHERRLANLFRPPFDIMSDLTLDQARQEAQETNKLVLVNIQDPGEFSCQRLNRDIWRSKQIKEVVFNNFVFLQYIADDPDGEDYRVLYPFEDFPHISILDPWTGEQQKSWGKVPSHDEFIEDLYDFVAVRESVDGTTSSNDQRNLSDSDSLNASASRPNTSEEATDSNLEVGTKAATGEQASAKPSGEASIEDSIRALAPDSSEEPAQGPNTTRVQLRFSDGKRNVRRFNLNDPVSKIYGLVKHILGTEGSVTLSSERRDLKINLHNTIEEAGLKNSTVLVELE